jgi:NAD(P)-dependent dehydrogenase (short-subunit alcohol dehydrogenase family)
MLLSGKVSIITGGSMGIGRSIAATFLREGSRCVLIARGEDALTASVRELAAIGPPVKAFAGDVSKEQDVAELINFTLEEFGTLDVFVNCAGVLGPVGPSTEVDPGQWWKTLEVNLLGTFLCCRAALHTMVRQRKRGKIINLSGGGAAAPFPGFSAYAASKAAVVRLTETLAEEYKQYEIDINVIAPGAVNTRLLDQMLDAGEAAGPEQTQRALKQKEEGGASPELAAELAVYLASSRSDGLTGKFLSAVWDDWRSLPDRIDEVMGSDVFTLRRVTPEQV